MMTFSRLLTSMTFTGFPAFLRRLRNSISIRNLLVLVCRNRFLSELSKTFKPHCVSSVLRPRMNLFVVLRQCETLVRIQGRSLQQFSPLCPITILSGSRLSTLSIFSILPQVYGKSWSVYMITSAALALTPCLRAQPLPLLSLQLT